MFCLHQPAVQRKLAWTPQTSLLQVLLHFIQWEEWYAAVDGRSIRPREVSNYLNMIREEQVLRFEGQSRKSGAPFALLQEASDHLKEKDVEFGADIVGICEIEPSDVYQGVRL